MPHVRELEIVVHVYLPYAHDLPEELDGDLMMPAHGLKAITMGAEQQQRTIQNGGVCESKTCVAVIRRVVSVGQAVSYPIPKLLDLASSERLSLDVTARDHVL